MSNALRVAQRREIAPALAVEKFDLLGRLAPALRRPQNVGTQADRLTAADIGDQFQRQVVAADIGQRARLQQQPLVAQFIGQIRGARGLQRRQRAIGLAVHQIDDREPGRDLGARGALQAVIDLVLEQFGGLVEQIDRHQPVGEPADHLVAAPPDRRQLAEIVEQAERLDRRQRVALAGQEQAVEGHRRLVLDLAR